MMLRCGAVQNIECDSAKVRARLEVLLQRLDSTLQEAAGAAATKADAARAEEASDERADADDGETAEQTSETEARLRSLEQTCEFIAAQFFQTQVDHDKQAIQFTVDEQRVSINYSTKEVKCDDESVRNKVELLMRRISSVVERL